MDHTSTPDTHPEDSIRLLWRSVEEHFGTSRDIRLSVIESLLRGGYPGGWSITLWHPAHDRMHQMTERIIGHGDTRKDAILSAIASMPAWAHVLRNDTSRSKAT